jgi:phage-related protein (TIGR01555 family)
MRTVQAPPLPKREQSLDEKASAMHAASNLLKSRKSARDQASTAEMLEKLLRPAKAGHRILPAGVTTESIHANAQFDYKMAMDSYGNEGFSAFLGGNVNAAFNQGYAWPGFTILAEWSQISEFRRPAEVYAREMTRKWIKFQAASEDDNKSDKIKKIEREFKRLNVQSVFRKAIEQDGLFGRSQIFLDMGSESDNFDVAELATELVETPAKVPLGGLKRLTVIEPLWSYPNRYNANDPTDPTFYKPISWFVIGKEIHSSRLLTVITRQVSDILKPAYAFAGLSLSQLMKPYVDNWLRTRQSVSDLIHSFSVWVLKMDMSVVTKNMQFFYNRLELFNDGHDNQGIFAVDKDAEDFSNVSAPLGGLSLLQAQSQEHQCAPTGVPLVYLTGITPSGLNASSEGEIEVFQDTCAANQEIYTPTLLKILNIVQLSLFGEIDDEITFVWEPLKFVKASEIAAIRKLEAETDDIRLNQGVLSPMEVRTVLANEEDSPYSGLDVSDIPEAEHDHGFGENELDVPKQNKEESNELN